MLEHRLGVTAAAWGDESLQSATQLAFERWVDDVSKALEPFIAGKGSSEEVHEAVRDGMPSLLHVLVDYDAQDYAPPVTESAGFWNRVRRSAVAAAKAFW